jgi:predicted MFS family arabinose efflux permease
MNAGGSDERAMQGGADARGSTSHESRASARWWSLAVLTLARAAIGFQFQSVAAVAPLMAGRMGIDKAQLGGLIGLYLLPGVVFALPGGLLGARFGDRRLVLWGLALMAAGGTWLGLAGSLAEASAARGLSGIGAVMLNVLVTKMVADLFDGRERLLAMSVLINSWPIGIGLALLLVAPLGQAAGWRWAIATTALFAAIGFAAMKAVYRAPLVASQAAAATLGLGALSRTEWLLLLVGSFPWLLYNAAFQIMVSFLPSFLVEQGFDIARAGHLVASSTVVFVVAVQAGGFVLKRARRPDWVCHLCIAGWCLSLWMLASGAAPLPWIVAGGLLGGIPAAAFVSLPAEFLRPASRGAGMGVFFTLYYLGCALLPALAGALYDRAGSGRAALWMAAVTAAATVPVLWIFRSVLRKARSA